MVAVVPLKYGTAFKKAFSDPEVFRGFIRDIVGVDLQIDKVEQEKGFSPVFGRVDIHYDLFAEDKKHRAIAEIQHIRESDTFDRFLFYHMIAQAEQIRSGEDYHFARTVYTVVVLTRLPDDPRYQFDIAVHDSDLRDTQGETMGIYFHKLIFLNARCIRPTTPEPVRRWLELIEDSLDSLIDETKYPDDLRHRVIASIEQDRVTPQEARVLKDEASWEVAKSEAKTEGKLEGKLEQLTKQFTKRLKRSLTEEELVALSARVQKEGPDPASDAVLELSPEQLAQWLASTLGLSLRVMTPDP